MGYVRRNASKGFWTWCHNPINTRNPISAKCFFFRAKRFTTITGQSISRKISLEMVTIIGTS